jgi:hypothetical protein
MIPIETQTYLEKFCKICDGVVYIDYQLFKPIANELTYDLITNFIVETLKKALINRETFKIHLSLKSLTLKEIEKHYGYISNVCTLFKEKFPDKLETCFIYNAPFIFSQIIGIISIFIDKKTQKKIQLKDKKDLFCSSEILLDKN